MKKTKNNQFCKKSNFFVLAKSEKLFLDSIAKTNKNTVNILIYIVYV